MRRSSASYCPRFAHAGHTHAGVIDVPEAPGFTVNVSQMRQYIAAVDESAKSLDDDQYKNLVYDDPDELQKKADLESEYGDASGTYAQVPILRARAKTRSADQVSREEDWGAAWRDTYGRWQKVKAAAGYPGDMDAMSTGKWYQVRDVHKEINLAHDGYEALGYHASLAKKEEVTPSGIPDVTSPLGLPSLTKIIPWVVGGAIVVGAIVVVSQLRPLLGFAVSVP